MTTFNFCPSEPLSIPKLVNHPKSTEYLGKILNIQHYQHISSLKQSSSLESSPDILSKFMPGLS